MGAVVQFVQGVPLGRPEPGDRGAGPLELVDEAVVHLGGADRIQQDVDLDAGGGAFGERLGELRRDGAGPVDVGGEVDRLRGVLDRFQHGGEDLAAVAEHRDPVALA